MGKKNVFAKDTATAARAEPVSNHQPLQLLDHPLGLPSRGPAASLHTEAAEEWAEEITYFIDEDVNNLSFLYVNKDFIPVEDLCHVAGESRGNFTFM